jgi:hypothetical protein
MRTDTSYSELLAPFLVNNKKEEFANRSLLNYIVKFLIMRL